MWEPEVSPDARCTPLQHAGDRDRGVSVSMPRTTRFRLTVNRKVSVSMKECYEIGLRILIDPVEPNSTPEDCGIILTVD